MGMYISSVIRPVTFSESLLQKFKDAFPHEFIDEQFFVLKKLLTPKSEKSKLYLK